ncbi:response regulator [Oculatella sp. LEGE 06141]|uniref:response regulator n=1 Tax=Oculatella sp. LEGE 06141 TaxID=1828648 RepID=UPI0030DB0105
MNYPVENQVDILIVDDVPENIRLLSSLLESHGYCTRKATSTRMALTAIHALPPSLILLDIQMPDINGYEVCQQLKSSPETAHIPIIFLSADDDAATKSLAFKVGGTDYITKPFQVDEVLARVRHQVTIITAHQMIQQLTAGLQSQTHLLDQAQLPSESRCDPLAQLPNQMVFMKRLWDELTSQEMDSVDRLAAFYLSCDRPS